jgi:hypothetical protein
MDRVVLTSKFKRDVYFLFARHYPGSTNTGDIDVFRTRKLSVYGIRYRPEAKWLGKVGMWGEKTEYFGTCENEKPVSTTAVGCCLFDVPSTTVRMGMEFPLGPMSPPASSKIWKC